MQLGIGTVQFGINYGISNQEGQTSSQEVTRILEYAQQQQIVTLDTAAAYGQSECVLGQHLPPHHLFQIITKTPHFSENLVPQQAAQQLRARFEQSLVDLKQVSIKGLMIHQADDLAGRLGASLFQEMSALKAEGKVQKIGVSIYNATQLEQTLDRFVVDIIQLPLNVFDQRLYRSGHLRGLKAAGVEVHVRSIFLQGLLLMPLAQIPRYFDPILPKLQSYHAFLEEQGLSLLQGALAFVQQCSEVDIGVLGVNHLEQLQANVEAFQRIPDKAFDFATFAVEDEAMINPSLWKIV